MTTTPWMPLYVADYLADTGHLSTDEHGAYLLLIMHYWRTGGLPDDDSRLASITRLGKRWPKVSKTVRDFFHAENGTLTHKRIDLELAKALKMRDIRVAGGIARAQQRYSKPIAECQQESSQSQSQPQLQSEALERSIRKPPISPTRSRSLSVIVEADGFDDFWAAYPRKVGKGQARKAWNVAVTKTSASAIVQACEGYRWSGSEKYTPHPATWLTGERWADERPVEVDFLEGLT